MSTAVFGPGHVVAGRYRIERLLGQGGMGSVYRAVQLSVGRTVALKLLAEEHDGSGALLERFQREALALARLTHENTVRLFDFGTSERGLPFLVMEFLRGADLARDIELQGPLRYDHALQVTRQLLCSLSEAHDAGIVHRDIKPGNVFLCAANVWPRVKVLDFGIVGGVAAEVAAPKLTRTGTVLGSAAYMSPEQAQGLSAGAASDLYAVGVVLFEMLTQRTLFDARPLTAQLLAKVMERAPRLRDVRPELGVPHELEALVAELVERDPSQRPASARAVLARVDTLLERAALPPLVRAVVDPAPRAAPIPTLLGMPTPTTAVSPPATGARGIPATEPMLVLPSDSDGWAPRPSESFGPAPAQRPRRRLRSTFGGMSVATLAALLLALRSAPAEPTLAAMVPMLPSPAATTPAASTPAASPPLNGTPVEAPDVAAAPQDATPGTSDQAALASIQPPERTAEARDASPSHAPVPDAVPPAPPRAPPERTARKSPPRAQTAPRTAPPPMLPTATVPTATVPTATVPTATVPTAMVPAATVPTAMVPTTTPAVAPPPPLEPAPTAPAAVREEPPVAPPTTLDPERTPEPREPPRDPAFARERPLSSMAAVEAAYRAGELSRAERNELLGVLRQLHADAQGRALRAYREGRISRRELWLRQRAIEREYVGAPVYPQRRGRMRLMW